MTNREDERDSPVEDAEGGGSALARRGEIDLPLRREIGSAPTTVDPVAKLFELAAANVDPETLERMVSLAERMDDRRAEQEMVDALARFHGLIGPIPHDSEADFATRGGTGVRYTYASLGMIAKTIRDPLAACGLSYSWSGTEVVTKDGKGGVALTAILRHVGGARREAPVWFPFDSRENRLLSDAQKVKVVTTFGQRVSLIQVLGLTTAETDTDAKPAAAREREKKKKEARLSDEKVKELEERFAKIDVNDRKDLLRWAKARSISEIHPSKVADIDAALDRRIEEVEKKEESDA